MRFLYISTGRNFPPDKHLIDGLRECGHTVVELVKNGHGPRFVRRFREAAYGTDAVIIGYGLPLLVPFARCLTIRRVIFNAISSQYEANVISRGIRDSWSATALKWWLIDLLSFHLASFVLLESNAQIDFIRSRFLVPRRKLVLARMGVDETVFFRDERIPKNRDFTVLFRGRFLPESGILTVITAAKKLEDTGIRFLIIGHGFLYREVNALMETLKPKNIDMIQETLPAKELREKMLACHLSLGQLADHPRLLRTLPAKLYESLALGLPYLTGRNAGVLEILKEDETCVVVEPGDANALAEKILFLKNHPEILREVAERGYLLYKERFTSRRLAEEFITSCFKS